MFPVSIRRSAIHVTMLSSELYNRHKQALNDMGVFNKIENEIKKVIHGKDEVIRLTICAVLAGGHVLLEDIPGVGPARRKALLKAFGSLKAIREADLDTLTAVPGMNRTAAEAVRAWAEK